MLTEMHGMFMVTDDLTVTPLFMQSTLSTLTELRIPLSDIEELEVNIGLDEVNIQVHIVEQ